jgi:hypothetical protein
MEGVLSRHKSSIGDKGRSSKGPGVRHGIGAFCMAFWVRQTLSHELRTCPIMTLSSTFVSTKLEKKIILFASGLCFTDDLTSIFSTSPNS